MSRHQFAEVERNIDRGATKLREQVIRYEMGDAARSTVNQLVSPYHEQARRLQMVGAIMDACAEVWLLLDDPESLLGKLGSLCGRHAPDIASNDTAKAKAEAAFRKGGA